MARPITAITDTFKVLRDNINTISNNVGDPDLLTTTTRAGQRSDSSDVVSALNELDSDLHGAGGGDVKSDLNYLSYAINTVRNGGLVGAINAIDAYIGGDSDTLNVESNTLIASINEIEAVFDASTKKINTATNFTFDGGGDLEINVDGGDVVFKKDSATHATLTLGSSLATTLTPTGAFVVDATGDITLDAGGNDLIVKGNGTTRFNYALGATNTTTVTGNLTYDVSGDIVLDAGGNDIDLKGAGTTRFAYGLGAANTLDVTGSLTQTVSSNFFDSANGTYHIGATGATDITTLGTFTTNTAAQTHNVTGDVLFDVSGDITLDADGGNVYFKDGGVTDYTFNTDGTVSRTGDLIFDISGNITLDADGNNIYFKDGTTTNFTFSSGTISRTGTVTIDASANIVLDADGANIDFKDGGVARIEYGLGATNTVDVTGNLDENVSGNYTLDAEDMTFTSRGDYSLSADSAVIITGYSASVNTTDGHSVTVGGNSTHNVTGTYTVAGTKDVTIQADSAGANFAVDVAGNITLDADGGNWYFKDGGTTDYQFNTSGTISRIGNLTLDISGDIVFDADGGNIDFKDGGTTRFAYYLDSNAGVNTLGITGAYSESVSKDYTLTATDSATINAGNDFAVNTTNGYIDLNASGARGTIRLDAAHAIVLDADDGDVYINDGGSTAYHIMSSGTISRTGDLTLDISGDITLDAGGGDVFLKDGGTQYGALTNTSGNLIVKSGTTTALTFSGANVTTGGTVTTGGNVTMGGTTISRTGVLTFDASSNINIDAGGGYIYLKDDGTQFGALRQSGGDLIIQNRSANHITFDSAASATFVGEIYQGGALGTTATSVAGAIKEVHDELDSASGEIASHAGRLNTLESEMDSNEGIIGVSVQWNVDNPYSWPHATSNRAAINDLDSAVGHLSGLDNTTFAGANDKDNLVTALNVLAGDVQDVQGSAGTLDSRIGSLANLAAFFDSAGATSSLVNALNHLASRVVTIYDENGVILNT